jgi:hypothetical protein
MNHNTRTLGATALLLVLSVLATRPALADHRRHDKQHQHHNNHQAFNPSYYNHQNDRYRYRRSSGHGVYSGRHDPRHHNSHGHHKNDRHHSGHYNHHSGYGNAYGGHYSAYQSDHHRHRYGIVVLRGPAPGYSHCQSHGGYYRSGDVYYG